MTVRSWRRLRDDGEREESTRAPCLSLGLVLVTASALLFGIVAAFIKAIDVPTLVLQLVRSLIEWLLGIIAALVYRKKQQPTSNLVLLLFGPAELRGLACAASFSVLGLHRGLVVCARLDAYGRRDDDCVRGPGLYSHVRLPLPRRDGRLEFLPDRCARRRRSTPHHAAQLCLWRAGK